MVVRYGGVAGWTTAGRTGEGWAGVVEEELWRGRGIRARGEDKLGWGGEETGTGTDAGWREWCGCEDRCGRWWWASVGWGRESVGERLRGGWRKRGERDWSGRRNMDDRFRTRYQEG